LVGRPRPKQHCVRWRPRCPPPKRGLSPIFGRCLLCPNGWMDQDICHWYGDRPRLRRHCVRREPSPPPKKAPIFGPRLLSIVAKGLYVSGYHLVRRYRPQLYRCHIRRGPSSPSVEGAHAPNTNVLDSMISPGPTVGAYKLQPGQNLHSGKNVAWTFCARG